MSGYEENYQSLDRLHRVPMVARDGSKSIGVLCCDRTFATAAEADAHELLDRILKQLIEQERRIASLERPTDHYPTIPF